MSIDLLGTYPLVAGYTLLAQSGITSVSNTVINNNKYGNAGGNTQITGSYVGSTATLDNSVGPATTQAGAGAGNLSGDINAFTADFVALPAPALGIITITPGVYKLGATTISDNIIFSGSSTDQFFIISTSSITLATVGSIGFTGGAQACNVFWLTNGSGIFSVTGPSPSPGVPGIIISSTSVTFDNNVVVNGNIYAVGTNVTFGGASNTVNGCVFPLPPPPPPPVCFVKGTKIMTNKGFVPIEDITLNDSVVTSGVIGNKGVVTSTGFMKTPIVFIGHFSERNLTNISRPIVISKDALGRNVPTEDVRVSPNHAIVVNGRIIHAKDLVNDETIYQDMECDSVVYYHIMTQNHFILNSSGLWSESLKGCAERFTESASKNFGMRNNARVIKKNTIRY